MLFPIQKLINCFLSPLACSESLLCVVCGRVSSHESRESRYIDMASSPGVNLSILRKSDAKASQAGRSRSSTQTSNSADYFMARPSNFQVVN